MKMLSKKGYTTGAVNKIIIYVSLFAVLALTVTLWRFGFFHIKTEEEKQFDLFKQEIAENVTFHNDDRYYLYTLSDFENSEAVELYLTTDEDLKSEDFYDILCTIKNTEEYLKTRDDCKDKPYKIGFQKWKAGRFDSFDITFDPDGRSLFYFDWITNADLTKLAEVFPNINEAEFTYQTSEYAAINIDELSELTKIEKLKFILKYDKVEEYEKRIREVFPDCELDIRSVN